MIDAELTKEMWADFIYEGRLDPRLRPEIADSWQKCRRAGVNPNGGIGKSIEKAVFESVYNANRELINTALPIMRSVFNVVQSTSYLMVLTDSLGYILETMGDEEIKSKCADVRFEKGKLWSSSEVGTNAISIALEYDLPIQTVAAEHYCRTHQSWTCSAAPIHGHNGEIIGCIDLSGDVASVHEHTLGLAIAAAYGIEGQIKIRRNAMLLNSALDASTESIFLVGSDYRTFWMNKKARKLCQDTHDDLQGRDFREILPDAVWAKDKEFFTDDTRLVLSGGTQSCGADISPIMEFGRALFSVTLRKQKHLLNAVNKLSRNRAMYSFEDFLTNDSDMIKTLSLAKRIADYDGNILIEGESGTGKEMIAQSIHNAGNRHDGPFVTVNCATIPREMLESELFGCVAGAFGGKITEGSPGRFELAQHGTVLLDEISEMPLEFQTKLLRTVENHSVRRLGSSQDIALDIQIIAATNAPLDQLVAKGAFRADLYHRLNVLKLYIKPLRQRPGDIALCADSILRRLNANNPGMEKTAAPGFMKGLLEHDWPGNVRELQNGLERAFYSDPGRELSTDTLRYVFELGPESEAQSAPSGGGDESAAGAIRAALALCSGSAEAAAERLGCSRATLYRRMKEHGIKPKSFK
ncbi:MAG: sigma-54-dependent Fis family transcriptional regulator [Oscillospiraceae bacterium]|nr:sigma-54-dependent Fis family transcriptional regulator [Oscillospiraceae bacterium]